MDQMKRFLWVTLALSCGALGTGTVESPSGQSGTPAARTEAAAPAGAIDAVAVAAPADLPSAPPWADKIRYVKGRGSVMLYLPKVAGAADYRVYALAPGVIVKPRRVEGATIFCAGLRQHNQCDDAEAMDYGPSFNNPRCAADVRAASVSRTVVQQVQVDGLAGKSTLVVEAVDGLCPFPGAWGGVHQDIGCVNDGRVVDVASYGGKRVEWERCPKTFPVRTEQEIRAEYGSLIVNGQAPVPSIPGESPFKHIALPAPDRPLGVLKRAVVQVEPLPADQRPAGFSAADFFESFSDPTDTPKLVKGVDLVPKSFLVQAAKLYRTSKLNLYTYAAGDADFFLSHGTLRMLLPDIGQAIMAGNVMYPQRAYPLPAKPHEYIHVTFETQANATQRRYFWFHACGAQEPGKTMIDGMLAPASGIVPRPSFMEPLAGYHISTAGWNCVQLVPRGGGYGNMDGGPSKGPPTNWPWRPETDVRVVVNIPGGKGFDPSDNSDTIINVSPAQDRHTDPKVSGGWMRQWDANKKIVGVMLDDQMFVEQRTTFDVYFNRDRIVMYANGVQKLCNDLGKQRLSMAEAAIGVGHVLYHSSAERGEFARRDWIRTGQYYYRYNTPFLDHRSFDNFGIRAAVPLPKGFAPGQCFTSIN